MANKFVWSGAGGLNDGSSWDNAYTSLMRDWGAEAGFTPATDYVYVRSVHAESSASGLTITGEEGESTTAPSRVLCVVGDTTGTTPGNLATGATVTTTGGFNIVIDKAIYIYGVQFYSSNYMLIGASGNDIKITLESCRLELTSSSSGSLDVVFGAGVSTVGIRLLLKNCDIDFNHAGQAIDLRQGELEWHGGSILFDINQLVEQPSANGPGTIKFTGLDFSIMTSSSLFQGSGGTVAAARLIYLSRCLLPTGVTIVNGTIAVPGFRVESYHCQIGTDADPSYQMEIQDSRGKVSANTAKYRTGGASDGVRATPISWDFDTTVGSVRGYPGHAFEGPPITAWTAGDGSTAHTYRVAFASDATINDDEFWIELEGPNDAATNSLAALKTTRVAPQTTAAACTTDGTSTWNGTGVTTKQYVEVSYTPDKPGPVTVRCYMAKASDNIYVDPKIQIDPA